MIEKFVLIFLQIILVHIVVYFIIQMGQNIQSDFNILKFNLMKYLIFFILITLISCEQEPPIVQDPNNKTIYSGSVYMERNESEWKALPVAKYSYSNRGFYSVEFDSLSFGLLQRNLGFTDLPINHFDTIKNFTVTSGFDNIPRIYFTNIDVDVAYDVWQPVLSDSSNNWIKIDQFDTISKEVSGSFSATLVRTNGISPGFPDTMRFRKGVFNTKLMN